MSGFFWNVRRFIKTLKHSVVKEWVGNKEMLFGCLLETRVREKKAERIINSVFKSWSSLTNYEHNVGGRIWLVWRDLVRTTPVFKSDQMITCSVALKETEKEFFCTFIYARNTVEERKQLWDDLCDHHSTPLFQGKAWMIMGDFNEILAGEEHSGYEQTPNLPQGMQDFQKTARFYLLTDLGSQGPLFTWCNKREEGLVCKKLDRVLLDDVALLRFAQAYSVFEPGGFSDHLRCRIQLINENVKIKKPFKYVNSIGKLPSFLPMVEEYWASTDKLFHSTSALFRFSKKLKALKPLIRTLGREQLGNLTKRANEAHIELCEKQKITLLLPSAEAIKEEGEAYER